MGRTIALMDLAGRHVVVTGAARGIGAALARRFHADGANVVVADLDGVANVADELASAVGIIADISTEAGNVALIEHAEAAYGPIDLFFANAGVGVGTDLETSGGRLAARLRRQRQRPPLGGQAPRPGMARPRRGVLLLDRVGGRGADPDRVGAVHAHQARRRRVRRVAVGDLRPPRAAGELPVPAGRQHRHAARRRPTSAAAPTWCGRRGRARARTGRRRRGGRRSPTSSSSSSPTPRSMTTWC